MGRHDELLERSIAARHAFWSDWGEVDSDVLVPLVNPAFVGGPRWPSLRQAFVTVRRGSLTLIATDGLSDPFDDEDPPEQQGLGLEFFAVTKDPVSESNRTSWLFDLVSQMALNAAHSGQIRDAIDQYGTLSSGVYDVRAPGSWLSSDGVAGVLLGVDESNGAGVASQLQLPLETVRMVNVKLLTPAELAYAVDKRAAGREELARLFGASRGGQLSSTSRSSVV